MDDIVTRPEYEERMKRIDDEQHRQNKRLDKLEDIADKLTELTTSVKTMAESMSAMKDEQKKQGNRLEKIEEAPADKWNTLVKTVLTVLITAAVTWFLSKGGI